MMWNWKHLYMVHFAIPIPDSVFSAVCLVAGAATEDVVPSLAVWHMKWQKTENREIL